MTGDAFRGLALSFEDATESAHMRHQDFRVGGKIFATLCYPDRGRSMVKLTPVQQRKFVVTHPDVFVSANGAWGLPAQRR
jgi:YjbR